MTTINFIYVTPSEWLLKHLNWEANVKCTFLVVVKNMQGFCRGIKMYSTCNLAQKMLGTILVISLVIAG